MSQKSSAEKWFSLQLFSASFVRNAEAAIRGVLYLSKNKKAVLIYQKAVLKYFAIFMGKHLCRSLFLIKL